MADHRYPIGPFSAPETISAADRKDLISELAELPERVRSAVAGLGAKQLDTPYREGGWTVRQVVHHLPDSHANSYVRFRLALTEREPTIRLYDQDGWAELADARSGEIDVSLDLLEALHRRLVALLETISDQDWNRTFVHPEIGRLTLDTNLAMYAWHGRHHVAHVTGLRERKGW